MPGLVSGRDESGPSRGPDDWAVMRRTVEFVGQETLDDGEDATLAIDAPPRASCVAVRREALPKTGRQQAFGFVDRFEENGFILLGSKQPGGGGINKHYLVCDITRRSVYLLPVVPPSLPLRPSADRMGILRDPWSGGRDFTVAQLHPSKQRLLCFNSRNRRWREEGIAASPSVLEQLSAMETDLVFAYGGILHFVDLNNGILVINVFNAECVTATFINLPLASDRLDEVGRRRFCVAPSSGTLMYVLVNDDPQAPTIRTWVLDTLDDGKQQWSVQHNAFLHGIQNRDGSAWLAPGALPVTGVVHPCNQHIFFFFLGENMVSVNLEKLEVLHSHVFHSTEVGDSAKSSLYVWAWMPPPMAPRAVLQVPSASKMDKMRQCAKLVIDYIREHPGKALQMAGAFVEKGGMIVVPVEWRVLSNAIASGLKEAGLFIEGNNIGRLLEDPAGSEAFTGTAAELRYVRTPDEARQIIHYWETLGRPDDLFRVVRCISPLLSCVRQ